MKRSHLVLAAALVFAALAAHQLLRGGETAPEAAPAPPVPETREAPAPEPEPVPPPVAEAAQPPTPSVAPAAPSESEPAPGVGVEGTLEDERGSPVAGETVELTSAARGARHATVTAADGSFSIPGVEPGPGYYLSIRPQGPYADHQRALEVGPDGLSLEIALRALATVRVRGQLVDVAGEPIPGLELSVVSGQALGRALAVMTDAKGRFEVDDVPSGHLTFTTRAPERLALGGVLVPPGADADLLLRADWGDGAMRGRVLGEGGRPLAGAEVELSWSHVGEGSGGRSVRSAVTGADGAFEFGRLGAGIHRVEVRATGHRELQLDYEVGPESPGLEVQLEPVRKAG